LSPPQKACAYIFKNPSLSTSTKHTTTATRRTPSLLRLALHLLANLDINLEELGYTAVETHGFAFVEVRLAVGCVDAFFAAGLDEAVVEG
jgi:hypothetical protein